VTRNKIAEWRKLDSVDHLVSRGYPLSKPELIGDTEIAALQNLDVESLDHLLSLGLAPKTREWWKAIIANRDINKLRQFIQLMDPNEEFRKYKWNGVYSSDYPLTMVINARWQEGYEILTETGCKREKLTAQYARGKIRYHDIEGMLKQMGLKDCGER